MVLANELFSGAEPGHAALQAAAAGSPAASTAATRQPSGEWCTALGTEESPVFSATGVPCEVAPWRSPRDFSSSSNDNITSQRTLKKAAFFCFGAASVMPWDCVVLEMGAFQTRYLPTYPWIETATEVGDFLL